MIESYYLLEILTDVLKAKHKIKVGAVVPRFDCKAYNGDYEGIKPFVNTKGMFKLSLMDTKEFIKADKKRMAEFVLVGGKNLNFSSLYFEDGIAYGNPNGKPHLKDGRLNPMFPYRQDLFIFLPNETFSQIEVFVLRNQKGYATELLQSFSDGDFDDEVANHREGAKTFFDYEGGL
jgi:hypothetical protein